MTKTSKYFLIAIVICLAFFFLAFFSESFATNLSGRDGTCDYCSQKAGMVTDGKEYCASCFKKYDGNFWN